METQNTSTASWTTNDVRAFLAAYGRTPAHLVVEQLRSWWCNTVLRLDADGERLVLRRYGLTPPEEVLWELALLRHLRAHEFPTISPLARPLSGDAARSRHGGPVDALETHAYLSEFLGSPAILYPYIEGVSAREGRVETRLAITRTAAVVARLHELTVGLVLPHPRLRSGTDSRRLLRQLLELAARRDLATSSPMLHDMLLRAEQMVGDLGSRIAPYDGRLSDLPRGVVHHDAHWANVLFRGDQFVALIDFDDACEGFLVEDLAAMIANWASVFDPREALDHGLAALVVHEYERWRTLTAVERDLLPDFVAAFMLADGATYVWERLEQGADGDAAVNDSTVYRRFLEHAGDPDRMLDLRRMLARPAP